MNNLLKIGLLMLVIIITSTVIGANGCLWLGDKGDEKVALSGSSGIIYQAIQLYPRDGSVNVPLNAKLAWAPAVGATYYDVYFGAAEEPEYQTTITATNIIVTPTPNSIYFLLRYNPGALNPNTTYYWKIDSRNDEEIAVGNVWSFTTIAPQPPPPAILPLPRDGAINVPIYTELSWTSSLSAVSYDVYFGTTEEPEFAANILRTVYRTRYLPGQLEYGTTYYWRVDANNEAGTTEGRLWKFTTLVPQPPLPATSPCPPNNAVNVPIYTQLSWASHVSATSYDVYFGDTNPPDFAANVLRTLYRTRYYPGVLEYGTTYYWKVDAKNDVGTTEGTLWTFKTLVQLPPPPAYAPLPPNNAVNVPVNTWLAWAYVYSANAYDVYFGATNTPEYKTTITNTNVAPWYSNLNPQGAIDVYRMRYNPGLLEYGTTYYWRIDTRNSAGTTTGFLWRFTTLYNIQGAPPRVATTPPTNVTENSATLNGVVNPNGLLTVVYFQVIGANIISQNGTSTGVGYITPPQFFNGVEDINVSFNITNLTPNTYYYYRCFATNLLGTRYGAYINFTTFVVPAAPTNLTAVANSFRQVTLEWTDNSGNENGFIIERSLDGITFTYLLPINWDGVITIYPPPPQVPRDTTRFVDFRVQPSTTYYYRVCAVNAAGKSEYSNVAEATTPEAPDDIIPPTAPITLTARLPEVSITIYPPPPPVVILNWAQSTDNVGVAGYKVLRAVTNSSGNTNPIFELIATIEGDITTYTDTNVAFQTIYWYKVSAFDAAGNNSPFSPLAYVFIYNRNIVGGGYGN